MASGGRQQYEYELMPIHQNGGGTRSHRSSANATVRTSGSSSHNNQSYSGSSSRNARSKSVGAHSKQQNSNSNNARAHKSSNNYKPNSTSRVTDSREEIPHHPHSNYDASPYNSQMASPRGGDGGLESGVASPRGAVMGSLSPGTMSLVNPTPMTSLNLGSGGGGGESGILSDVENPHHVTKEHTTMMVNRPSIHVMGGVSTVKPKSGKNTREKSKKRYHHHHASGEHPYKSSSTTHSERDDDDDDRSRSQQDPPKPAELTLAELNELDNERTPLFCDHPSPDRIRHESSLVIRPAGATCRANDIQCSFILLDNAIHVKQQLGYDGRFGSFQQQKSVLLNDTPCNYIRYRDIKEIQLRSGEGCSFSIVVNPTRRRLSSQPTSPGPGSPRESFSVSAFASSSPTIGAGTAGTAGSSEHHTPPRTISFSDAVGINNTSNGSGGVVSLRQYHLEDPYVTFEAKNLMNMFETVENLRELVDKYRRIKAKRAGSSMSGHQAMSDSNIVGDGLNTTPTMSLNTDGAQSSAQEVSATFPRRNTDGSLQQQHSSASQFPAGSPMSLLRSPSMSTTGHNSSSGNSGGAISTSFSAKSSFSKRSSKMMGTDGDAVPVRTVRSAVVLPTLLV